MRQATIPDISPAIVDPVATSQAHRQVMGNSDPVIADAYVGVDNLVRKPHFSFTTHEYAERIRRGRS